MMYINDVNCLSVSRAPSDSNGIEKMTRMESIDSVLNESVNRPKSKH